MPKRSGLGPRLLPYVSNGPVVLLRSRSVPRLLRRLDLALGAIERPIVPGLLRIAGFAAITRQSNAVLVPTSLVERSTAAEKKIEGSRCGIVEEPAVLLDVATGEVVVLPGLIGEPTLRAMIDGVASPPGRYQLRSLFWPAADLDGRERRSLSVARLLQHIVDTADLDPESVLAGIVKLSDRFSLTGATNDGHGLSTVIAQLS